MLKSLCAAALFLSASTAFAQDTVTWKDDIQGWSVVIDRTIQNSCFIISKFDDDVYLRFQFNSSEKNVQLIVANIRWSSLKTGQSYGLEVAFDDASPWSGMATGHVWSGILPSLVLSVPVEDQQASNFLADFTGTEKVSISHDGAEIANLPLIGTDAAVASMMDCQEAMTQANAAQQSGDDPFATKPEADSSI